MCKRRLFPVRAAIIAVLLALVLCEIGLRLAVSFIPPAQTTSVLNRVFEYRYLNDDSQWATHDLALPGYTVRHDERATTDQPTQYTRTVWLFGSSSLWGAYSADKDTIASALQRELNRRGIPWLVRNIGQIGADVTIEYYWLRRTVIQRGDLVVFFDGAVNLRNAVIEAEQDWKQTVAPCAISQRLALMLLNLWCQSSTQGRVPVAFLAPRIKREFVRYWRDVDAARHYTLSYGATWLHVMQPGILIGYDDLYFVLAREDTRTSVPVLDYLDDQHYDNAGNVAIARQIAALFGPF